MAQKLLTNSDNIFVPNGISCWFKKDWTGNYVDLGDLEEVSVTLDPTFDDVYSTRFGLPTLRARRVVQKNGTISFTLREPNVENLNRVLYGGTVTYNQSVTVYETAVLDIAGPDSVGYYVDWSNAEDSAADVTSVVAAYFSDDIDKSDALTTVETTPDSVDNKLHFETPTRGFSTGDEIVIYYTVSTSGLSKFEIFGATDTKIEGAALFQARCLDGGIPQLWELVSVSLSPNGDLTYPLDGHQTVPLQARLQERNGTFGYIYLA